jgi:hypothetical protein
MSPLNYLGKTTWETEDISCHFLRHGMKSQHLTGGGKHALKLACVQHLKAARTHFIILHFPSDCRQPGGLVDYCRFYTSSSNSRHPNSFSSS